MGTLSNNNSLNKTVANVIRQQAEAHGASRSHQLWRLVLYGGLGLLLCAYKRLSGWVGTAVSGFRAADPGQTKAKENEVIVHERQRIAREIHDGVAQDLAALSLKVRQCQGLLPNDLPDLSTELDEMQAILNTTLVELRRIIHGLRPASLEEQSFASALHILAAEFSAQYPLYVHLNLNGVETLPNTLEASLFRIVQEALHNVVQHAQATCVQITLVRTANKLIFSVNDNGHGLSTSTFYDKSQFGHFGLKHMYERVHAHQGTMSIESKPGRGTTILAVFPQESVEPTF